MQLYILARSPFKLICHYDVYLVIQAIVLEISLRFLTHSILISNVEERTLEVLIQGL